MYHAAARSRADRKPRPLCPGCHAWALNCDELQTKRHRNSRMKQRPKNLRVIYGPRSRQTALCKQTALSASLSAVPRPWLTDKDHKAIISPHQSQRKHSWEILPVRRRLPHSHPTPLLRSSPQRADQTPPERDNGYRTGESGRNVLVSVKVVL